MPTPEGGRAPASSSSPGQWATPAEQRWLGTGEDGDATGELRGSPESFRYRCPRALLGGHKGPSRGTSHATRRPAVFPPGLLPPYGAVGDNVRFSFFFFFFGRRRQDERGCGDGFPSDSVWLRLAVVSVCSPRTHEQREEARGRERGQCWPPRPAARPAPRADRRARAGDGDRKAACPRSRREPRAPPWAPAACPWGTDPHGPLLSTPSSFTCSRLSSGTRKGHWSPSRVIRNQKGKTDSPKAPGGGRADSSFRPARTPHPQT